MKTTGKRPRGRALTTALVLTLLAALLLAGTALAAAKPGRPTAKAPAGTVTTTTPSFKWSKAKSASKYELRVYQGKKVALKKTGLKKTSYKAVKALPTNVDLTWKVRGSNARGAGAWSKSLTFKIVTGSSDKAITAFIFTSPAASGTINETLHTIAVSVPFGTSVSALVASFTTTGAAVAIAGTPQVSGVTVNDFANPTTYTVTAADGTTQAYVVTVTVAASSAKAITAFGFLGLPSAVIGTITEAAHTIALIVPIGTPDNPLVASFITTGAAVSVGATAQTSGTTANDFTSSVTYTVIAADSSTQTYVVTVYRIGKSYQGGKIAYILESGDFGYSPTVPHGLIAATADEDGGAGIIWALPDFESTSVPGTSTAIGSGAANTDKIIAQNGAGSTYAAGLARAYAGGGYSDWYLPSKGELNKLFLNRVAIGGFETTALPYYWNSSEWAADMAWFQAFDTALQSANGKDSSARVRAVRSF